MDLVRILLALLLIAPIPAYAGQPTRSPDTETPDILVEGERPGAALYAQGDVFYENGQVDRARANFSQACALDLPEACDIYGVMATSGEGGLQDNEIASDAFQRSCLLGSRDGCLLLSSLYLDVDFPALSVSKVAQVFATACESENASACTQSALFLFEGVGGPKDLSLSANRMNKACNLGDEFACELVNQTEKK